MDVVLLLDELYLQKDAQYQDSKLLQPFAVKEVTEVKLKAPGYPI